MEQRRGTGSDDLLYSRNARLQKALVGRAQWEINQAPSLRDNEQAWREHSYCSTSGVNDDLTTPYFTLKGDLVAEGLTAMAVLCSRNVRHRKDARGSARKKDGLVLPILSSIFEY